MILGVDLRRLARRAHLSARNALNRMARDIFAPHERDYVNYRSENNSGERVKSEVGQPSV
jgi:hypothetical protein